MQNRTQIFAACALPVMMGMALLAGCEGQNPANMQSQMSVRQLDKASAVKTGGLNLPNIGVNKPGTGSITIKVNGFGTRRVLYTAADVNSILIFLSNDSGGADIRTTITAANITAGQGAANLNSVPAGNYTPFVSAWTGANADGPDMPNPDGDNLTAAQPAQQFDQITVSAGQATPLIVGLQLADTPAGPAGSINATINLLPGN